MNTKKILPLLFCFIIISSLSTIVSASSYVTVSVNANPSYYRLQDAVITGILAQDGSPVSNGLVGLQISVPDGNILTMRTVNTGSNPTSSVATIQSVHLSDSVGNPISGAPRGTIPNFQVTVTNNAYQAQNMMVTLSVYDNKNSPIGFASNTAVFQARETRQIIVTIPIPSTAYSGMSRVFANAYSNELGLGGAPYSSELSSTFGIDNLNGSPPPDTPAGSQGNYQLGITFPINAPLGTHTILASSNYNGLQGSSSATTSIYQRGDFNSNGVVNAGDVTIFIIAYNNFWNNLPFNPVCDMNQDSRIDANDVTLFIVSYSQFWQWQ
jgi:hypothetical protein